MSVQAQINRIKGHITNAYTAIRSMGVDVPTGQYLDASQLSNYIMKIPKADTSLKFGGIISGVTGGSSGYDYRYTLSTTVDDISISPGNICGFIKDVDGGMHSITVDNKSSSIDFGSYHFATGSGLRLQGMSIEFYTDKAIDTICIWSSTSE